MVINKFLYKLEIISNKRIVILLSAGFFIFYLGLYYIAILRLHFFDLEGIGFFETDLRAPLIYIINETIYYTLGRTGVYIAHFFIALITIVGSFYIIKKLRHNNVYLVLFSLFLFFHLRWHEELFRWGDTILFGATVVLFISAIVSDLGFLKKMLLLGFIGALGWLSRATGVIFIPMIAIVILSYPKINYRKKILGLFFALLLFCVVISPWQVYLYNTIGHMSLSAYPGAGLYNVARGQNIFIADIYPYINTNHVSEFVEELILDTKDKIHIEDVAKFIIENPGEFVLLNLKKFVFFILPLPTPFGTGTPILKNGEIIIQQFKIQHLYRGAFLLSTVFTATIFFAYVPYFLNINHQIKNLKEAYFKKILIIFSLLYLLIHLATWVDSRFILPIHPLWFIAAAIWTGDRILFYRSKLQPSNEPITLNDEIL